MAVHIIDKAVSLEFKHLSGSHLERTCSIVMDVSTEGTWQGNFITIDSRLHARFYIDCSGTSRALNI